MWIQEGRDSETNMTKDPKSKHSTLSSHLAWPETGLGEIMSEENREQIHDIIMQVWSQISWAGLGCVWGLSDKHEKQPPWSPSLSLDNLMLQQRKEAEDQMQWKSHRGM